MASATSITARYRSSGFTLVELMVAMTIGSVLVTMVMAAVVLQSRMSTAVANHETANRQGRIAMKQFESDIRQARNLLATTTFSNGYDPTRVNLEIVASIGTDGTPVRDTVTYAYDSAAKTLWREQPAGANRRVLISDLSACRFCYFGLNDNPLPSTKNPAPSPQELRKVLISAVVSKNNLSAVDRENLVTASVVLRRPLL